MLSLELALLSTMLLATVVVVVAEETATGSVSVNLDDILSGADPDDFLNPSEAVDLEMDETFSPSNDTFVPCNNQTDWNGTLCEPYWNATLLQNWNETDSPTESPTEAPETPRPTSPPVETPAASPDTDAPTKKPTSTPTVAPKPLPPTEAPSKLPTKGPTRAPTTLAPTVSSAPSIATTSKPSASPSLKPSQAPTLSPSGSPTELNACNICPISEMNAPDKAVLFQSEIFDTCRGLQQYLETRPSDLTEDDCIEFFFAYDLGAYCECNGRMKSDYCTLCQGGALPDFSLPPIDGLFCDEWDDYSRSILWEDLCDESGVLNYREYCCF